MKRFMTLILVLLLMFSITLTGCGGEEAPADATDPGVEEEADAEASVSKKDIIAKFNVLADLFNELDAAFVENGTYDTEADVKAAMDYNYDYLEKAAVVVESDEVTDEERAILSDEFQIYIDEMNGFKDTYM